MSLYIYTHIFSYKSMYVFVFLSFFFSQYIGSKETDQKADKVSKLGILDFWTPENHYRWSVSRYGGHVSGSVEPVKRSQLFLCGIFLLTFFYPLTQSKNFTGKTLRSQFSLSGLETGEVESLKFKRMELQEYVTALQESVRSLQIEERQAEEEAAKLQKQRVMTLMLLLITYTVILPII